MNNLLRSITLLLLMFILGSVSAQNTSLNIKGIVRDAMGDPFLNGCEWTIVTPLTTCTWAKNVKLTRYDTNSIGKK